MPIFKKTDSARKKGDKKDYDIAGLRRRRYQEGRAALSRLATEKLERNGQSRGKRSEDARGRDICIKSFFISPFTAATDHDHHLCCKTPDSRAARFPFGRMERV